MGSSNRFRASVPGLARTPARSPSALSTAGGCTTMPLSPARSDRSGRVLHDDTPLRPDAVALRIMSGSSSSIYDSVGPSNAAPFSPSWLRSRLRSLRASGVKGGIVATVKSNRKHTFPPRCFRGYSTRMVPSKTIGVRRPQSSIIVS